ncbi:MAG: MerR family transcriptional regulator [Bryobacterales bacterium]|nr:MerR family transcriptional regulator [Bryobacterales bacterium]
MAEQETPKIPDRLFFRIGDVSQLTGIEAYVLRFWEGEFPALSPKKTSSGQRQYRRKDVETVLEIKRLLYDEGYTIAGARKAMRARPKQNNAAESGEQSDQLFPAPQATAASPDLTGIKQELREILALLNKR